MYSKSLDELRKTNTLDNQQKILDKQQAEIEDIEDERAALKIKILKAINKLPEQQKIVIKLFYLEDYSLKQISKTLKITIGTAKSRLFYAREKLRLILKK